MAIRFQVLGIPGRDNALLVRVDTGQLLYRFLFDCGEGVLNRLDNGELHEIDALFFSHFHMDHAAGFDSFFRLNYNRPEKPVRVFGPPQTIEIMSHRFQGFIWNLVRGAPGVWHVSEIGQNTLHEARFLAAESFSKIHPVSIQEQSRLILDLPELTISSIALDHRIPSIGYLIKEKTRENIDPTGLARLGLHPGPWLKEVKEESADPAKKITIGDREFSIGELRKELLVRTEGQSLAYLTDFSLTAGAGSRRRSAEPPFVGATEAELTQFLKGCDFIVCEGQYREEDRDLARKNFHLTAAEAAKIAQVCGAKRLTLFHLSDRYQRPEWQALLAEARAVFKETYFPEEWRI